MVFAQLEVDGERPRRARLRRADPRQDAASVLAGVRIEDDGPKIGLNGVDNGRLWFDGVRVPRDQPAQPLRRRRPRTARYYSDDREPRPAVLHHARHAGAGPGVRRRRRHQRPARSRSRWRSSTPTGAGSSARRTPTRRSCCSTTACTSAGCCPLLARTYALHFAQEVLLAELHDVLLRPPTRRTTSSARRALESRAAGTKALGTWHAHAAPSRSAARRAAAPATCWPTGSPRCGPTPTCSPRSRATTTCCCSWSPRGCSPTTPPTSRTSTRWAWSGSSPGWRSRPCVERTAVHKLLERIKDVLPGGDDAWDQRGRAPRPGRTSWRCSRWREEHILSGVARRLKRGMDRGHGAGRGVQPGARTT